MYKLAELKFHMKFSLIIFITCLYKIAQYNALSPKPRSYGISKLQHNQKIVNLQPQALQAETFSLSGVGVVLLAGGKGKRMKAAMPKQFLPILGRPVFLRSLDIFTQSKLIYIAL